MLNKEGKMRRLLIVLFIGVEAVSAIGIAVSRAADGGKNVTIVEKEGDVEVMQKGTSEWKPAEIWMKLGTGDKVKTKKNSHVDLNFNGMGQAALVRVAENSSMDIKSYVAAKEMDQRKISLDLAKGDILVKASKLKGESQFQVHTPTSVVGVRGTGFKVHVSAEE